MSGKNEEENRDGPERISQMVYLSTESNLFVPHGAAVSAPGGAPRDVTILSPEEVRTALST
jgi:hypothetical protein